MFRDKHGRDHKYTPEGLWDEFHEYAKWLEANPLMEAVVIQRGIKINTTEGEQLVYQTAMPKMRPMTLTGFCIYADIDLTTYEAYRKQNDYVRVTTRIDIIIRTQKFEGAASGFFNANIIARDLGLVDKQGIDHTSKGQSIDLSGYSAEEKALLLSIARKGKNE